MDKETRNMKLAYWAGIIREAKSSGMSISKWCTVNQISNRKFYYWHKKVMHDTYMSAVESGLLPDTANANDIKSSDQNLPAVPDFAELSVPDKIPAREQCWDSGISIKWGDFTIAIKQHFSEEDLTRVMRAMHHV